MLLVVDIVRVRVHDRIPMLLLLLLFAIAEEV
jgi:hypothetical protein